MVTGRRRRVHPHLEGDMATAMVKTNNTATAWRNTEDKVTVGRNTDDKVTVGRNMEDEATVRNTEDEVTSRRNTENEVTVGRNIENEVTAGMNTEDEATAGMNTEDEATAEMNIEDEATAGMNTEDEATVRRNTEDKATAGRNTEDEATAGMNIEDDATAGRNTEDEATADRNIEDEATAGRNTEDEATAGMNIEDEATAGRNTEDEATAGRNTEDEASAGMNIEDEATAGRNTEDEATAGRNIEDEATAGMNTEDEVTTGRNTEDEATAGMNIEDEATAGMNTEDEATAGRNTVDEATSGMNTKDEVTAGMNTEDEVTAEMNIENEVTAGRETEDEATAGMATEDEATAGRETEDEVTAGMNTEDETTAGLNTEDEATSGRNTEDEATAGRNTEDQATAGMNTENEATAGMNTEDEVTAGMNTEDMATAGRETEDMATAGRETEDAATIGRVTVDAATVGRNIENQATAGREQQEGAAIERGDNPRRLPCFRLDDIDLANRQLLGQGGFGNAYLVRQISRNRMVVVKTPNHDQHLELDVMNELMVLRRICMTYIVEMLGVVYNSGNQMCGILLEHVALGSVDNVVRKRGEKLPWALQLRVMYQTAKAMKYLHENHVLHLDLNTRNILLDESINVKVADFGLSKIRQFMSTRQCRSEPDAEEEDSNDAGTEFFIAPEVIRDPNRQPSRKWDVYAFAITMWQIVTGEWPFSSVPRGMNHDYIRERIMASKDPLRPDITEVPQVTSQEKKIFEIMKQSWDQDPGQRAHFADITPTLHTLSDELASRAIADVEEVKVGLQSRLEVSLADRMEPIIVEDQEGELAVHRAMGEDTVEVEAPRRGDDESLQQCSCQGACNCPRRPAPPQDPDDTILMRSHTSPPSEFFERHTTAPSESHESHRSRLSASSESHISQSLESDESHTSTVHEARPVRVGQGSTRPQPNTLVLNVQPNEDTSSTMPAELKAFPHKVFEAFEQPRVWAMIKEEFRNRGIEIQTVRKGCIEIIFKDPISADNAKRLVSTLEKLEESLTKILMADLQPEHKDKFHLKVAVAEEVRTLATTSKIPEEDAAWDISSSRRSRHAYRMICVDVVKFGENGEAIVMYWPPHTISSCYQWDATGRCNLTGVHEMGKDMNAVSASERSFYTRQMGSGNVSQRINLDNLQELKEFHHPGCLIGVINSDTLITALDGIKDKPETIIIYDPNREEIKAVIGLDANGTTAESTCVVGAYLVVYCSDSGGKDTLYVISTSSWKLVSSSDVAPLQVCPHMSAYGASHVIVGSVDIQDKLFVYHVPSNKLTLEISIKKQLNIDGMDLKGLRYTEDGRLYLAYVSHEHVLTLFLYKVLDFLGQPSFERLGTKRIELDPKREYSGDVDESTTRGPRDEQEVRYSIRHPSCDSSGYCSYTQ